VKYPAAPHTLIEAGYKLVRKSTCRGANCDVQIHWYLTPSGKHLPLSYVPQTLLLEPHFVSCPNAPEFRKAKGGPMKFTAEFIEQRLAEHKAWQEAENDRLLKERAREIADACYPRVPPHSFPAKGAAIQWNNSTAAALFIVAILWIVIGIAISVGDAMHQWVTR
jgi:hypothetical protein